MSNEEVCSNSGSVTSHREVATVSTWVFGSICPWNEWSDWENSATARHRSRPSCFTLEMDPVCRTEGFDPGEVKKGGHLQGTVQGMRRSLHWRKRCVILRRRLKEHKRHVEKSDPKGSAIAEHVLKTGHSIAWDKAQVIDYEQRWGARKIKESLHIKRERANRQLMNRDGGLAISRVWQHVIWRTLGLTLVLVSIFRNLEAFPYSLNVFNFVPVPFGTKPLPWFVFSISDMVSFLFSSLISPSEEGAHSCLETSWEKSETKSSV